MDIICPNKEKDGEDDDDQRYQNSEEYDCYEEPNSPSVTAPSVSEEAAPADCAVGTRLDAGHAALRAPVALASAPDGSVYVGDAGLIRRLTSDQQMDTLLRLDSADADHPYFMAVHPITGQLHISLPLRRQIWKLVDVGHFDIVADARTLHFPKGIAFDTAGTLLVVDGRSLKKLTISAERPTVQTLAGDYGTATAAAGGGWKPLRGCARTAALNELVLEWPTALCSDPISGHLFLLDSASALLRLDLPAGVVTVVAGAQTDCASLEGGAARPRRIDAMALDASIGTLYWAETTTTTTPTSGTEDGTTTSSSSQIRYLSAARNYPAGAIRELVISNNSTRLRDPMVLTVLASASDGLLIGGVAPDASSSVHRLTRYDKRRALHFDAEHGVYRVNSSSSTVGGEDADLEQFEFDARGWHTRTSASNGTARRNISYYDAREETEAEGVLLRVTEAEAEQLELRVRKEPSAANSNAWTVRTADGTEVLRVTSGPRGEEAEAAGTVQKITGAHLAHPVQLEFSRDGLLETFVDGPADATTFRFDAARKWATRALLPDGRVIALEEADDRSRIP